MSHEILQTIWFSLIFVLFAGYAVLDGFDFGVGMWHLFSKNDRDRRLGLNAIGPVWDGNEVWLLTGGGALFAAFPPVYALFASSLYLAICGKSGLGMRHFPTRLFMMSTWSPISATTGGTPDMEEAHIVTSEVMLLL